MHKFLIEFNKKRNQFEVWKLNKKGYYNFVSYANSLCEANKISNLKSGRKK